MNKKLLFVGPASLCLYLGLLAPVSALADTIDVAVANSTCGAMQRLGHLYEQRSGHLLSYQCKASGLLAKGLKGGAISADIYVSASKEWMDFLIDAGMVDSEFVSSPWRNHLVLAAAKDSPLEIRVWSDLATNSVKTVLIGDPGIAPFGRYAKEALQHTAVWEQVRAKIITKKHITLLADSLANADDATVGILFSSNVTPDHKILYKLDEAWHTPIRYYAAPVINAAESVVVSGFLRFLQGEEAREIFEKEGFTVYAAQNPG